MGKRANITFLSILGPMPITQEREDAFFGVLDSGLLLALKEEGILTQLQYQAAEALSISQRRLRAKQHD